MSQPIVRRFTFLLATLVAPALAQAQSSINGVVSDSGSGTPIAGARVGISGTAQISVTNTRGEYALAGLGSGDYTLIASARNRSSSILTVHASAGGKTTADFKLALGSALLPGVIVSATRTPVEGRNVTATVHEMPAARVRTSAARTTDDMLREMPGLELPRTTSTASGAEEIVSIRGADEGRTLVLLDEVPLNDPWGEWIQWNRAPRFQVDHAEIVEGGGSSLYGNYAMGGVISLFSHPIAPHGYDFTASAGSRGQTDVSAYASDVSGRLRYSLGADYGIGGGYVVVAPSQRGSIDRPSTVTRTSTNARAEYALGDATTLFGTANYFSDNRNLGTPLTTPNHREIGGASVGANIGSVLGGSLTMRGFGQNESYDSQASTVNATRSAETPLESQRIPSHDLGASAQWSRNAGEIANFSLGGDFRYTTGQLKEDLYGTTATVVANRLSEGSQQVGGVFAQAILAPIDALRLEASARVEGWRSYNGSRTDNSTTPPTSTTYPNKNNTAFAPRLGARYAVTSSFTLRGSFYQAFRAPTLSEEYRTFFSGPNTFMGNPALTPEHLTGYDGGFDWQPITMIELRGTAFLNKYRDLDDFEFLRPGATTGSAILQRQNQGAAKAKGVEGELAVRPTDALSFIGSYNYDDARVDATKAFINRVPLQRGSLRATYDDALLATINIVYRYEGPNHALGGAKLAPFSVIDADVRREIFGGVEAFVAVENLFDHQYAVTFSGPLESIGLPRTIRGGLSAHSF